MYETPMDDARVTVRTFRKMEPAKKWLGLDTDGAQV